MALCRIYDNTGKEIKNFSTDDPKWGASISIGTSPLCAVNLENISATDAKDKTFFSLVKRENSWWLVASSPENIVLMDNEIIQESELGDGIKIEFGPFSMSVEMDKKQSPYTLTLEYPSGKIENFTLIYGVNTIGNSSENHINISDRSCSKHHAFISVDNNGFYLMNRDSSAGTFSKGSKIIGRTNVKADEDFNLGDVKARITENKKSVSFSGILENIDEEKQKWYVGTCICILIILILAIMIIWKKENPADASKSPLVVAKKSGESLPFGSSKLDEKIIKHVKDGNAKFSINLLDQSIRSKKDEEAYKLYRDALIKEKSAVSDLNYYSGKLQVYSFGKIEKAYLKFLLQGQKKAEQMMHAHSFWENVRKRINELDKKGPDDKNKYTQKIWKDSYFRKHIPQMKKKLQNLIDAYVFMEKINISWDVRNWEEILKELKAPENKKIIKENGMNAFCQKLRLTAQFGYDLKEAKLKLMDSDFKTIDLDIFNNECKKFAEKLNYLKTNQLCPYGEFKLQLDQFVQMTNEIELARSFFDLWENSPENMTITNSLAKAVFVMKCNREQPKLYFNAYKTIEDKMFQYIQGCVEKIKPTEDKKGLRQLDKLLEYSSVIYDTAEGDRYRKILTMRRNILRKIEERCDELYYQYTAEKEKGDLKDAGEILQNIILLAPAGNRYRKWAEKEMKNISENTVPAPRE
jgi:hypothetical protein